MAETLNRTLSRGMELLELISAHPEGLELSQIARALALPKSTAFNLVHTLNAIKYVERDEQDGRYRLGLRMFEVGSAAVNNLDAGAVMRRYMRKIYLQLNETMHCAMLSGGELVYIDKLESTRSIRMISRVGVRLPLYCTAMGKAMLAAMDGRAVERIMAEHPFEALTPRTIRDMDELTRQLEKVRAQGYAVEREESNENVCCVGVAILDKDKRPAYAMSVSAPSFRFTPELEAEAGRLLLHARERIERIFHLINPSPSWAENG